MKWQSIETAPKDGTIVLVCGVGCDGYFVADVKWHGDHCLMFDPCTDGYSIETDLPTHWMPLPPPPSDHQSDGASSEAVSAADGQ